MRIKKVEIDGFKSYSQRQVVDGFDSQFNAITGLNGSGKSNILDAICFLLGITNLQQVRAANLADLVYKQGQAGVTRATVTITFDNTDPNNRPMGFENHKEIVVRRQIIVNGRNTYQINGVAATNQRVTDMFKMVGMNVNNPHFLIMQGRITKVLNMKPAEILSMIEEAAGVRMYEQKKQNAIRIIDKKESKVEEIKKLMDEDILPRVEKLRQDRDHYLEFQRIGRDVEALERKLLAYEYHSSRQQITHLENESLRQKQKCQLCEGEMTELNQKLSEGEQQLAEMEGAKSNAMSSEKTALEEELRNRQTEQAKLDSDKDGRNALHEQKKHDIERRQREVTKDQLDLDKKRAELLKLEQTSGGDERRGEEVKEKHARAKAKLEALAKGMTTDEEGRAVTMASQLTAAQSELSQLKTKVKMAEQKLEQVQPTLAKKRSELARAPRRSDTDEQRRQQLEGDIARAQHHLSEINYDAREQGELGRRRHDLAVERQSLDGQLANFEARYHQLGVKIPDPYANFDRSRLKGIVAKLIRVKNMKYATAIEVAAGGKLYNYIVDEAETSRSILASKKLNRRLTFIPLKEITQHVLDGRKLAEARKLLGADNVHLAKDLIEYDPVLEPAMRHIFGNALICTNQEQAKAVTFNREINCRSVTISGDEYKPSGVLTGGSRQNTASVLADLEKISGSYQRRGQVETELNAVQDQLRRLEPRRDAHEEATTKIESLSRQLEVVKENLKNSTYQVLQDEIKELEKETAELRETIAMMEPQITEMAKKCRQLEDNRNNEGAYRESEKQRALKDVDEAQRVMDSIRGSFADAKERLTLLRTEIKEMENSIEGEQQEIRSLVSQLEEMEREAEAATDNCEHARQLVKEAQQALDNYNKQFRSHDKAIRAKESEVDAHRKRLRQLTAKIETLQKEARESAKGSKECAERVQKLERQHAWIAGEKQHFGEAGGPFDFTNYSFDKGKQEIDKKKDRGKELESLINVHAMELLGTAEQQCTELTAKREQLDKDKAQLKDAIEKLDEKKKSELEVAYRKISSDFDQIFSTLLPGTNAKLARTATTDGELRGLEVKIAFNNKWKESLGELSGGQRSLVALSLILAMLKFKPAPIYILDEIDAALDMSHTQNIGTMIKKHFKESQFIIVSLKDGMFNNANVLYRTKFADGTSSVTRTDKNPSQEAAA